MTTPLSSYPDPSTYGSTPGGADHRARQATGALREAAALALLGGNAVFLLLGFFALFFVVESWADGFGARADATFPRFVGLVAIGFPVLAVLLATHFPPVVGRARLITLAALVEYAVSGFLGLIGFIGRFAGRLDTGTGATGPGVRSAFDGLFDGVVWLGLLGLAALAVYRVWLALFYVPQPYPGYPHTYGQPYPGRPSYPGQAATPEQPAPTYRAGYARPQPPQYAPPAYAGSPMAANYPTSGGDGWPAVPPPPMPSVPPSVPRVPVIGSAAPPPAARAAAGPAVGSATAPGSALAPPPSGPPATTPSAPSAATPAGPAAATPSGSEPAAPASANGSNGSTGTTPAPPASEGEPTTQLPPVSPHEPPTQQLHP